MIKGVYKITNKKNNKIYIGSSNNITYRWEQHIYGLINKEHYNLDILNDFVEQGENINDFNFEVLDIKNDISREELYELEGKYILKYNSYKQEIGYNKIINNFKGKITTYLKNNEIITDTNFYNLFNYCDKIDDMFIYNIKKNIKIKSIKSFTKFKNEKIDYIYSESFLCKSWFEKNNEYVSDIKNMLINYFNNMNKNKTKMWTTYLNNKDMVKGKGYTKNFVKLDNKDKKHYDCCVFLCNIYMNTYIENISPNKYNQNKYALSFLLRWINDNIDITNKTELFIPNIRMYNLLNNFIYNKKISSNTF